MGLTDDGHASLGPTDDGHASLVPTDDGHASVGPTDNGPPRKRARIGPTDDRVAVKHEERAVKEEAFMVEMEDN